MSAATEQQVTRKRSGQQLDTKDGIVLSFLEWEKPYKADDSNAGPMITGLEGNDDYELTPIKSSAQRVREYDTAAINAARLAFFRQKPERIDVDLPLVLTAISVLFNKSSGVSAESHPTSQQDAEIVGPGSGSLSPRASVSSSASVQPAIYPTFKRFPKRVVAKRCELYINGNFTESNLRTRLGAVGALNATVNAWPNFIEVSDTFVLQGQKVSAQAKADSDVSGSVSSPTTQSYSWRWGNGSTTEGSTDNTIVQLPPSIHALITLSSTTDTATATAEATANTKAVSFNAESIAAITNTTGSISKTATGTITPTTAPATPVTAVPSTGLYLYDWKIDDSPGFGDVRVTAWVIDCTIFA